MKLDFRQQRIKRLMHSFSKSINNGINLYAKYLKKSVASKHNLDLIKSSQTKIVIDCVGGSLYQTFLPVLMEIGISEQFNFLHTEEDPFHHEVGKLINADGDFFDWGCDTTVFQPDLKTLNIKAPVLQTIQYDKLLADYPVGTVVLITDPDADRLVTAYIDHESNIAKTKERGLVYVGLNDKRILIMFTPNQSFLMNVDFHKRNLIEEGLWNKYDWFIAKTSASQSSWDEWAKFNEVPVVNTPVGFKELQDIMMNVEGKILKGENVVVTDVTGKNCEDWEKSKITICR
jgi:phosphomannomutase